MSTEDPLEITEELFQFLQGNRPDGYTIRGRDMPRLTAEQAWTVIWYLGNLYWRVPDFIERCCLCGSLYNSNAEGDCLDYGKAPYHFCDSCRYRPEYAKKMRRHPDKEQRDSYFGKAKR